MSIIGIIGLSFLLLAFTFQKYLSKINYNFCNFIGSSFLILYAQGNWIFIILNSFWASVSLVRIIVEGRRK